MTWIQAAWNYNSLNTSDHSKMTMTATYKQGED